MSENHLLQHLKNEKAVNKKTVLGIIMQLQNLVLVMLFNLSNEKNKTQRRCSIIKKQLL